MSQISCCKLEDGVQVGLSAEVDKQLTILRERVMLELRLHHELQQIQGMLEPILATALGQHQASYMRELQSDV